MFYCLNLLTVEVIVSPTFPHVDSSLPIRQRMLEIKILMIQEVSIKQSTEYISNITIKTSKDLLKDCMKNRKFYSFFGFLVSWIMFFIAKTETFKMITEREHLLDTIQKQPIAVFFYGSSDSLEYSQFEKMLPSDRQIFQGLEFFFIPSEKFKLARPNPSISIYWQLTDWRARPNSESPGDEQDNSEGKHSQSKGQWLVYNGVHRVEQISNWVRKNCQDPLTDLSGEQVDSYFVDNRKGFILLDFGQSALLRVKIVLGQFCEMYDLFCGKVTHKNEALRMVVQLMRAEGEPGVPKLAFWNPKSQEFEIYTKDLFKITENQIMELYSGHSGLMPFQVKIDVGEVIHPQTIILTDSQRSESGDSEL